MTDSLFTTLQDEAQTVQALYRSWRNYYREDTDCGTLMILQLLIDLTGFSYTLTLDDVENIDNMREIVREKIIKANYHDPDVFSKPTILKRISKFMELLIIHDSEELLLNNIWLNYFIKLLVALCKSNVDACQIIAGYLSMLLMVNLSKVWEQLNKQLRLKQRNDSESLNETKKHQRYVYKVSKMMLRNVEGTCGYVVTLPIIAQLFCSMLQDYPRIYIVENCMLEMLDTLLKHRHGKTFQIVAACFRVLLDPEVYEEIVVDKVSKFFIEIAGKRFTQAMFNYKSNEKVAMEVVISVQRLYCGNAVLDEAAVEKIRQQMFNNDEMIRGLAIDFHICTLCSPDDTDNRNLEILQHILKLYVQYDHSADSLIQLVADLWKFEFFDDWNLLFNLLNEETARDDNHFMVISIVQIINKCYTLLMNDLVQTTNDRSRLSEILENFLIIYPTGLKMCQTYEYAYISLLESADATYHDTIKLYGVHVNRFYDELFAVLVEQARIGINFFTLSKTVSVLQSYWNIIPEAENVSTDIMLLHINDFMDIRGKMNNRNLSMSDELTNQYTLTLVRLTSIVEMTLNVEYCFEQVFDIMLNDYRLLNRLQLSNLQVSMFYRLFKSLFFVLISNLKSNSNDRCSADVGATYQQNGMLLKKRLLELLRVLIKQLQKYDETLDSSVHIFISICDVLLVTQTEIVYTNIAELKTFKYTVEPALLQKMAKFLLNYVFSKNYDWRDAPLMKQKQMLAKYVQFYEMHKGLPSILETHYVLTNYAIDSAFDEYLRNLMKILYRIDFSQFCDVIAQVIYQLLAVYKSESSVKNFLKKFQKFALTDLSDNDRDKYQEIIYKIIEKILDYLMQIMLDPEPSADPKRMLKLLEPVSAEVSTEQRLKLQNILRNHAEYERLVSVDQKLVNRFIKHLGLLDV